MLSACLALYAVCRLSVICCLQVERRHFPDEWNCSRASFVQNEELQCKVNVRLGESWDDNVPLSSWTHGLKRLDGGCMGNGVCTMVGVYRNSGMHRVWCMYNIRCMYKGGSMYRG